MLKKNVIVASLATKEAVEIASELSAFGMHAVTRTEISGKIPQDADAFIIDNSTGEQVESLKNVSTNFGISSRIFVIEGGEEPAVFEENNVLYISSKLGAKNISGIVNFCLNPMFEIDNVIKKMLFELGFQPRMRGHRYIIDAVKIILDEPKKAYNVNKNVYEAIGQMHGYNRLAIERSIRTAIESAYYRDTKGKFIEFFGCLDHRPTNTEFLSVFVERLMMKF